MTSAPFSCNPGDTLRVTKDRPHGTPFVTGDLVTVAEEGVGTHPGPPPLRVVVVYSAYGKFMLGFDALEAYKSPGYTPAEPDDVVDGILAKMAEADPELADVVAQVNVDLGAMDAASEQISGGEAGSVTVDEATARRRVGPAFSFADQDGDEIEVAYYEQDCSNHGREGGFLITINDEAAVVLPATQADALIRYLIRMKKHSERDQ